MSAVNTSAIKRRNYATIRTNRASGAVKSLILEYEQVLSPEKCDNIAAKVMGGEISTTRPVGYTNNLVKQRISEFSKREIECNNVNKTSINDKLKKSDTSYQRSKSVDYIKRKGKDEYWRLRQVPPKIQTQLAKEGDNRKNSPNTPDVDKKLKQNKSLPRKLSDKIKDNCASIPTDILKGYVVSSNKDNIFTYEENTHSKHAIESSDLIDKHNLEIDNTKYEVKTKFETSTSVDEFEEIENKLKDVEKTIGEMRSTLNEPSYISKIHHIFTNNIDKNSENSTGVEHQLDKLDSIENIDICLYYHDDKTSKNEDFGEVSKGDLINADFIEAYNQVGYELLITSVSSVRDCSNDAQSITEDCTLELVDDIELAHSEDIQTLSNQEGRFLKTNSVDNKIYFTTEELETLIPDDDYSGYLSDNDSQKLHSAQDINGSDLDINIKKTETVEIFSDNEYKTAIKSETTIYDSFQNPRIAKVTSITRRDQIPNASVSEEDINKNLDVKPKITYIIAELIETEKKYINHMQCILLDYYPYLKTRIFGMQRGSKVKPIFGNIRNIYNETLQFYKTLKNCSTYVDIAKTFIRFEPLFEMYPTYCKNKPSADHYLLGDFREIVTVREKELNDQLGLTSHLLTPIQRLGKYKLFLEQIEKELLRDGHSSEYVTEALSIVRKQMATGDLYIAVDSIKKSPINLEQQGWLLLKEKFNVLKPKKYEAILFLFEKIVVFTTEHTKNSNTFIYRDSIYLNELGISSCDYEMLLFILKRFPAKEQNEYTIEAKKSKDKKIWTDKIEKLLWEQLIKCREKQRERNCSSKDTTDEIPKTRRKKSSSSSLPGTLRPKSKFYVNEPLSGVEQILLKK